MAPFDLAPCSAKFSTHRNRTGERLNAFKAKLLKSPALFQRFSFLVCPKSCVLVLQRQCHQFLHRSGMIPLHSSTSRSHARHQKKCQLLWRNVEDKAVSIQSSHASGTSPTREWQRVLSAQHQERLCRRVLELLGEVV